jgi:hypothetical protein
MSLHASAIDYLIYIYLSSKVNQLGNRIRAVK